MVGVKIIDGSRVIGGRGEDWWKYVITYTFIGYLE